ncbi:MAG: peptide-methionine (S)-S-oxide reductase MsrA [Candidatus Dojkabacteria bacterium]
MKGMSKKTAVFGGGCFWCVEAVFNRLRGVSSAISGFAGGSVENPSYEQVVQGGTGHAEVVRIEFDPDVISFEQLLEVFFKTHNPTTKNKQGNDVGEQYRSLVVYQSMEQKKTAEETISELEKQKLWGDKPFTTELVSGMNGQNPFYPAEEYHQEYFAKNPEAGYCRIIINPKIMKFEEEFRELLK